ncbi:hypothetical protein [Modestobacter sp. NPDC049651]|uniref:hypothetical protein n=1 Tax=unclassified Modestobacter TaxID=2643866 RepID=UPI0033DC6A72
MRSERSIAVTGDAADPAAAERAADAGESLGPLRGWVDNAALCGTPPSTAPRRPRRSS